MLLSDYLLLDSCNISTDLLSILELIISSERRAVACLSLLDYTCGRIRIVERLRIAAVQWYSLFLENILKE